MVKKILLECVQVMKLSEFIWQEFGLAFKTPVSDEEVVDLKEFAFLRIQLKPTFILIYHRPVHDTILCTLKCILHWLLGKKVT